MSLQINSKYQIIWTPCTTKTTISVENFYMFYNKGYLSNILSLNDKVYKNSIL